MKAQAIISAHSASPKFAQLAMFVKEPLELYGTSSAAPSLAEERCPRTIGAGNRCANVQRRIVHLLSA